MSSYDYIAANILHSNPPPRGFTVDVIEKDDEPGLVYLRLYAYEIHDHSESKAEQLSDWLKNMLNQLNNSLSIGKFTYEVSILKPR